MKYRNNSTLNISHEDAFSLIKKEEEEELLDCVFNKGKNWEAAFRRLVFGNLGLVVKIANDFHINSSMTEDLISEGVVGLEIAIMRFDPSKGAKLSTYASWWIKQRIFRHISNNINIIATPYLARIAISKIKEAYDEMGKDMTVEEMAEYTGLPVKKVKNIMAFDLSFVSLDDFTEESKYLKSCLHDVIEDETQVSPFISASNNDIYVKVKAILDSMPERKKDIFCSRYGIFGYECQTLDIIGNRFNLTKERVRQIAAEVLTEIQKSFL